jgi:hypothetical protein
MILLREYDYVGRQSEERAYCELRDRRSIPTQFDAENMHQSEGIEVVQERPPLVHVALAIDNFTTSHNTLLC